MYNKLRNTGMLTVISILILVLNRNAQVEEFRIIEDYS